MVTKRSFFFFTVASCFFYLSGFAQEKTAANLTEAFRFESENSQLFTAYANHAKQEGLPTVATFFTALAKTASIHAENFQKVLSSMGKEVQPKKPVIIYKTADVHVEETFRAIRIEAGIKYAEYLEQAKTDGVRNAVKALRWAKETEQAALPLILNVSQALSTGEASSLPSFYWICPKCGNLYDVPDPEEECSYCFTEKRWFLKIGK